MKLSNLKFHTKIYTKISYTDYVPAMFPSRVRSPVALLPAQTAEAARAVPAPLVALAALAPRGPASLQEF